MKRPFRRFEGIGLAAALAVGAGCTPNNSVKSGAPVLIEVSIVEGGGAKVTSIPAGAGACPAETAAGGTCDPAAATTCFLATASNWCRCAATMAPAPATPAPTCTDGGTAGAGGVAGSTGAAGAAGAAGSLGSAGAGGAGGSAAADAGADATAMPAGTWNCDPFAPTAVALFVFDRVLDTQPFDSDAGTTSAGATLTTVPPAATVTGKVDYRPNGSPKEVIFPLVGDFRSDGPSLLISGNPALPAGAAVTVALDPTAVRAKDHKTPFTDGGKFGGGTLTFSVGGFSASITTPPPAPLPADAGACAAPNTLVVPDKTAVTVAFTNLVDPKAAGAAITIQATSGGTTTNVPFDVSSTDNLTLTLTPTAAWPDNSSILVTVPGTITDLAGDKLAAEQMQTFVTGAL